MRQCAPKRKKGKSFELLKIGQMGSVGVKEKL